jgi:hypothetical protein
MGSNLACIAFVYLSSRAVPCRRLPTVAVWVRNQDKSCGVCGEQSRMGEGLVQVLRVYLSIIVPPMAPYALITASLTLYSLDTASVLKLYEMFWEELILYLIRHVLHGKHSVQQLYNVIRHDA